VSADIKPKGSVERLDVKQGIKRIFNLQIIDADELVCIQDVVCAKGRLWSEFVDRIHLDRRHFWHDCLAGIFDEHY
jgi:hypothetical protein